MAKFRVSASLDLDTYSKVLEHAAARYVPMSKIIRLAIEAWLRDNDRDEWPGGRGE